MRENGNVFARPSRHVVRIGCGADELICVCMAATAQRTQNDFHVAQKLVHYMPLYKHCNNNCGHAHCAYFGISLCRMQNVKQAKVCMLALAQCEKYRIDACQSTHVSSIRIAQMVAMISVIRVRNPFFPIPQSINRSIFRTIYSENRLKSMDKHRADCRIISDRNLQFELPILPTKKNKSNSIAFHSLFPLSVFLCLLLSFSYCHHRPSLSWNNVFSSEGLSMFFLHVIQMSEI